MDVDLRQKELLVKKLEIEIRELEKPFYKRIAFLSLLVPLFAAVLTAMIGYWGNNEIHKLEERQKQLQNEIGEILEDQQAVVTSFANSIYDYTKNVLYISNSASTNTSKDSKNLFTLGIENQYRFISSQKKNLALAQQVSEKYQANIGENKFSELAQKYKSAINQLSDFEELMDKGYKEILKEIETER